MGTALPHLRFLDPGYFQGVCSTVRPLRHVIYISVCSKIKQSPAHASPKPWPLSKPSVQCLVTKSVPACPVGLHWRSHHRLPGVVGLGSTGPLPLLPHLAQGLVLPFPPFSPISPISPTAAGAGASVAHPTSPALLPSPCCVRFSCSLLFATAPDPPPTCSSGRAAAAARAGGAEAFSSAPMGHPQARALLLALSHGQGVQSQHGASEVQSWWLLCRGHREQHVTLQERVNARPVGVPRLHGLCLLSDRLIR